MPRHSRTNTAEADDSDLLPIGEAARMLCRTTETLRKWSQQRPPRLIAYRDGVTKTRYFRRGDVRALIPRKES